MNPKTNFGKFYKQSSPILQWVQALLPQQFHSSLIFCKWLIYMMKPSKHFLPNSLFTGEVNFPRDPTMHFHNHHVWADENIHVIRESHLQQ